VVIGPCFFMELQHQAVSGPVRLYIDVPAGYFRIATQSLNEVLVDARQTHNKSLVPKLEAHAGGLRLFRQPMVRWFTTSRGVNATVLIPEGSSLQIKLYSGSLSLTGEYGSLDIRLRSGDATLNGPAFSITENGLVKILSGNLRCVNLTEAGFEVPLLGNNIKEIAHTNGPSLRVELGLGELDFS